jgi:hypothetical protein
VFFEACDFFCADSFRNEFEMRHNIGAIRPAEATRAAAADAAYSARSPPSQLRAV